MASFGDVLRNLGSVLNPQVEREMNQADVQQRNFQNQVAAQMIPQMIAQKRQEAISRAITPYLLNGDIKGAAAAAMSVPGGAQIGMQLLTQGTKRTKLSQGDVLVDAQGNVVAKGTPKPAGSQGERERNFLIELNGKLRNLANGVPTDIPEEDIRKGIAIYQDSQKPRVLADGTVIPPIANPQLDPYRQGLNLNVLLGPGSPSGGAFAPQGGPGPSQGAPSGVGGLSRMNRQINTSDAVKWVNNKGEHPNPGAWESELPNMGYHLMTPMDDQLTDTGIKAVVNREGKHPPAGLTKRQAQEQGYVFPAPRTLSADAGGRVALAKSAMQDIQQSRALLFGRDGKSYNKKLVSQPYAASVAGFSGMPGNTDSRNLYSYMENAISGKLRMETGAATNEGEIRNVTMRFMPTPADTPQSAAAKLDRLEKFMNSTLEAIYGSGLISQKTYQEGKAYQFQQTKSQGATDTTPQSQWDQVPPGGGKVVDFGSLK